LRKMARALRQAGHEVEVLTTCTRSESAWRNDLPAGTTSLDSIPVHRFPIDDHDRDRHLETVRLIREANGRVSPEEEEGYLRHSIQSRALIEALRARAPDLDAILVGPYLFGLTASVARQFPDKT